MVAQSRRPARPWGKVLPDHARRGKWWAHQDSNLGRTGYEPAALTAELWALLCFAASGDKAPPRPYDRPSRNAFSFRLRDG